MNPNNSLSHSGVVGMKWRKGVKNNITFTSMDNATLQAYIDGSAFVAEKVKALKSGKVADGKKKVATIISKKGQKPVPWKKKFF
jgi:hypothetical protein